MEQNQQQNQRLKPTMGENQPQKCPRCDSLNTKFCYYNNYSLSQPRYFCKTCRRYWTQGGTLRNIPVGGGFRKANKRTKINIISAGENSRSTSTYSQTQLPDHQQQRQQISMISNSNPMIATNLASSISSSSYYPLSSLAAIQSMNQPVPPQQPFDQPLNNQQALSIGGSSNLGLLQGYGVPSFVSQQQTQFFQMGNNTEKTVNTFPSDQDQGLVQSAAAAGNSSHQNWHQSFINNNTVSGPALWTINNNSSSSSSTTAAGNTTGTSMNPNQWPHLPGYGAPP